jgi:hypothetical protein
LDTGTVLVATEDAVVVGWAAARDHALGTMISDLFVSPDHQGLGIGRALLGELRRRTGTGPCFTFSSRHPAALPVYARAGLIPSWPLAYLSGPAPAPTGGLQAEQVDAATAARAEADLTGRNRSADYTFWLRDPAARAVVVRDRRSVVACGAVRDGAVLHLCCPFADHAAAALVAACAGTERISACLPGAHPSFGVLLTSGFLMTDNDIAMATPELTLPIGWVYSPGLG